MTETAVTETAVTCAVCGSAEFVPGYQGRLTYGKPPQCAQCGSAERHRIVRRIYDAIKPITRDWAAFQFAPDGSVTKFHFKQYDFSIYERVNSMPMEEMTLPDASYDIIISNHVMEHVQDPVKSIQESLRVVGEKGLVHVCVPSPMFIWETKDWGYPDPKRYEHYREYGADAGLVLARGAGCHCIGVVARDDATGLQDIIFFLSRSTENLARITHTLQRSGFGVVRVA
jgi:SAM-dependent methyltransferase